MDASPGGRRPVMSVCWICSHSAQLAFADGGQHDPAQHRLGYVMGVALQLPSCVDDRQYQPPFVVGRADAVDQALLC
jgi:hypothetical protein